MSLHRHPESSGASKAARSSDVKKPVVGKHYSMYRNIFFDRTFDYGANRKISLGVDPFVREQSRIPFGAFSLHELMHELGEARAPHCTCPREPGSRRFRLQQQ